MRAVEAHRLPAEGATEGVFEVIGRHAINGVKRGEQVALRMGREAIEALIEAGHIKPVVPDKPAAKPAVKKVADNV